MTDLMTNGIGMELVHVPPGVFTMGGDWNAEQADENELPKHTVQFKKPFYMGIFPVTQSQWQAVMGQNPSHCIGPDRPVNMVSHTDALAFIKRLNALERSRSYALPSEAQWEYAARAGSQSAFCFGADSSKLPQYAWYQQNSGGEMHSVGQLLPNAWGLYDMHGNVHEWCGDWFARTYYAQSPMVDPQGPKKGLARVLRGGDWGSAEPWYCRCAIRSLSSPDRRSPRVGFRVMHRA